MLHFTVYLRNKFVQHGEDYNAKNGGGRRRIGGWRCWNLAQFQWQLGYQNGNIVSLEAFRSYDVGVGNAQYGSPRISSGPAD
jgi:hypothetical protein